MICHYCCRGYIADGFDVRPCPSQRFAGSAALDRFGPLVVAQLALAAEFDAGGHGALPPFAGTLAN
jgi:hypothetical protein